MEGEQVQVDACGRGGVKQPNVDVHTQKIKSRAH